MDGGLIKVGPGTLTVTATNTYTGPTHVYEGVLVVSGFQNTMLQNTTNLYVAAGAGWIGTGDLPPVLAYSGHKLWGNGYLTNGNGIRIASGGILEPGTNGIGQLTFSNNVILLSGSTNVFELNKSALTNDSIRVLADVSLGGTLIVSNISGTLAAGDSFKLVDAATYSGSFSTVILPSLNAGLVWNTNSLNSSGIISVVSTATPVFASSSISGNNLLMTGSNGTANTSYYVLTSTNVALPMTNWARLITNQFDGSGNFIFSNSIDPATPRLFYRLQLPP